MKKFASMLCACLLCLAICFMLPGNAEAVGMDNFQAAAKYKDGLFTDIKPADWYYANIARMYEYGLVNGMTADTFQPKGNINIASLLALACRVHACYHDLEAPKNGNKLWYQPYIDYAEKHYIIAAGQFKGRYTAAATRGEAAYILSHMLPESASVSVNNIDYIPDVPASHTYYNEILYLYLKGIATGKTSKGDYMPQDNISRAEVMTMLCRMIDKTDIKKISITKPQTEAEMLNEVLRLANAYRNAAGINTLHTNDIMKSAAAIRAEEISREFAHTRPDGTDFFSTLKEWEIDFTLTAENIACGQSDPAEVIQAWLNSPDHREMLLLPDFTKVGCGYYMSSFGMPCWTMIFIAE